MLTVREEVLTKSWRAHPDSRGFASFRGGVREGRCPSRSLGHARCHSVTLPTMIGRRPSLVSPVVACGAVAALLLSTVGLTTASAAPAPTPKADPAPAAAAEPRPGDPDYPAAPAGSVLRVKLADSFRDDLDAGGAVIIGTGATIVDGGRVEIPIEMSFKDGFALAGGIALQVDGKTTYSCPDMSVWTVGKTIYCGKDGKTRPSFIYGDPETTTRDGVWQIQAGMNVRIVNEQRSDQMNNRLEGKPLAARDFVGDMTIVSKRLLRSWDGDVDDRTGCWIGYYAGDNSIWRGWAVQAMVNRLPKNVGMSQYTLDGTAQKGSVADPNAPAVAVGQRTPYMEGVTTGSAKKIIRGSQFNSDNFYDGYNYGCNTNAPFVVSQGLLDAPEVKAWRYDGGLRTKSNNPAGAARPQWWGHARQTDYDGPTGNYSWTCRGLPANRASTGAQRDGDTWWTMVSRGSGFFGDTSTDRMDPDAGRAPECGDLNLKDFTLTTRYSISKRGGLEARNDQVTYPRSCSVDSNPLVSCWQEIYPLWDRAWAFQNHVYASAMRANITSNATINIPAAWSSTGIAMVKPIAWRISDGAIGGAWPNYIIQDSEGKDVTVDLSGIERKYSQQDMSKVSPFTVPGTNTPFTVSGYGTPMGQQDMTFILTADTDGTWTWPVNKNGQELPRPQMKMTFNYVISNYDDGGTCTDKTWYDDASLAGGRNNDAAGGHCLQGNVPTIWPLPADRGNMWLRVPDTFITDKDGKRVRNTPNVTFEYTSLTSCLNEKELTVQDFSTKTNVPYVGADFTWDVRLSGQVKSFSGC